MNISVYDLHNHRRAVKLMCRFPRCWWMIPKKQRRSKRLYCSR